MCEEGKLNRHVVTIDDYQDVPPNDERALLKAVANQPVAVAIEADQVRQGGAAAVGVGAGCVEGWVVEGALFVAPNTEQEWATGSIWQC
jgi:KDEL-tailed cysteine endopeptidase